MWRLLVGSLTSSRPRQSLFPCPVCRWQSCRSCQICTRASRSGSSSSRLGPTHGHSGPGLGGRTRLWVGFHKQMKLKTPSEPTRRKMAGMRPKAQQRKKKEKQFFLIHKYAREHPAVWTDLVGTWAGWRSPGRPGRAHCGDTWCLRGASRSGPSPGWWSETAPLLSGGRERNRITTNTRRRRWEGIISAAGRPASIRGDNALGLLPGAEGSEIKVEGNEERENKTLQVTLRSWLAV